MAMTKRRRKKKEEEEEEEDSGEEIAKVKSEIERERLRKREPIITYLWKVKKMGFCLPMRRMDGWTDR